MKAINAFIHFFILIFTFVTLTTCENPIIEKWWEEEAEVEYDYVALIKNIPIYEAIIEKEVIYKYIYDTIYEFLPPEVQIEYVYVEKPLPPEIEYVYVDRPLPPEILLQHIKVVDIEFILFSGDQILYNMPSDIIGGTHLKQQEKDLNDSNIKDMADSLIDNLNQLIILHGHANPVTYDDKELEDLKVLSTGRAEAVAEQLRDHPVPIPFLDDRMTTRGYGGGKNISSSGSTTYAGLNRRVEMILIEIETTPGNDVPNIKRR